MQYFNELIRAMALLSDHEKTTFLGQGVGYPGTTMSSTFKDVRKDKLIEMPVAEDMQMGMSIGLSLAGYIPVCVFPRWNFMICATNQIINHLDRLSLYSDYRPKAIIRVAVPSSTPFNPGPQHDDNFSSAFRSMLRTTDVVNLNRAEVIVPQYEKALHSPRSTILVEYTHFYREARANEE